MKYTQRYAYYDLGQQQRGNVVSVRMQGSAANVLLLDAGNFRRYRAGERFSYVGGHHKRSPARLKVPRYDHWYVVLDHGGRRGRTRGAVRVVDAQHASV